VTGCDARHPHRFAGLPSRLLTDRERMSGLIEWRPMDNELAAYLISTAITTNKIIAGVVVLAVIVAGAGFYFFRGSRRGT
jgi:hypothetical protein